MRYLAEGKNNTVLGISVSDSVLNSLEGTNALMDFVCPENGIIKHKEGWYRCVSISVQVYEMKRGYQIAYVAEYFKIYTYRNIIYIIT